MKNMLRESKDYLLDYFYYLNKHNCICSSYLLVGNDLDFALSVGKLVNCAVSDYFCDRCDDCLKANKRIHPDYFIVEPEGSSIKIASIRASQRFIYRKSFQAKNKILVINQAHLLTLEAANAFLKTLEEPPPKCLIILMSERVDLIIPTILSRCKKIYLPFKEDKSEITNNRDIVDFLFNKQLYITDRESLSKFIWGLIIVLREYIVYSLSGNTNYLIDENSYEIIKNLPFSAEKAQIILEEVLKIYSSIDNINVNLACNLLSLYCS